MKSLNSNHPLQIVVAVIMSKNDQILLSQRKASQRFAGMWEFPGGKIEQNEDSFAALQRECREELAIHINSAAPLSTFAFNYDNHTNDPSHHFHVWQVQDYTGTPTGNEGQAIRWVSLEQISRLTMPAANLAIVETLLEKMSVK